jgi:hypothetical protein
MDVQTKAIPKLTVYVWNQTLTSVSIWEGWNSWGWWTFTVYLRDVQTRKVHVLTRISRDWTMNFPSTCLVPPMDAKRIELDLNDGSWVKPKQVDFSKHTYEVRIKLHIDPSKEGTEHHVFVGEVWSDWS